MRTSTKIAKAFIERATTQNLKGKKRDDAAIDFVCGAAQALHEVGHSDTQMLTGMAFLVAIRGYRQIEVYAKLSDE